MVAFPFFGLHVRSFQFPNETVHNSIHLLSIALYPTHVVVHLPSSLAHSANLINHMHLSFGSLQFSHSLNRFRQKWCSFGFGNGFSFARQNCNNKCTIGMETIENKDKLLHKSANISAFGSLCCCWHMPFYSVDAVGDCECELAERAKEFAPVSLAKILNRNNAELNVAQMEYAKFRTHLGKCMQLLFSM